MDISLERRRRQRVPQVPPAARLGAVDPRERACPLPRQQRIGQHARRVPNASGRRQEQLYRAEHGTRLGTL